MVHALLLHVGATPTVTLVTTRRDGTVAATPIWAVVSDGAVYARAVYGDRNAWSRRALSGRPVWFTLADGANSERDPVAALDDPRVEVVAGSVAADDPVHAAITGAYEEKYGAIAPRHLPTVQSATALAHTVRFTLV